MCWELREHCLCTEVTVLDFLESKRNSTLWQPELNTAWPVSGLVTPLLSIAVPGENWTGCSLGLMLYPTDSPAGRDCGGGGSRAECPLALTGRPAAPRPNDLSGVRPHQPAASVFSLLISLFLSLSGFSRASARPQTFSLSTRASLTPVSVWVCIKNLMTMMSPRLWIANYIIEVESNAEQKHLPELSNYWIKRFNPAVWRRRGGRKWKSKNQYLLKLLVGGVGRRLRRRVIAISINVWV